VLLLSDVVTTPLPWLRLDAIFVSLYPNVKSHSFHIFTLQLNLVWVLPVLAKQAGGGDVAWAWKVAGCFIPISYVRLHVQSPQPSTFY